MDSIRAEQNRLAEERSNYYNAFASSKIGFINCDRFAGGKNNVNTTVIFSLNANDSTEMCLLYFEGIKSIIPMNKQAGGFALNMWMPKDVKLKVLAVSSLVGKKASYIEEDLEFSPKIEKKLEYKPENVASFSDIANRLNQNK
jgi:hypothetical protein